MGLKRLVYGFKPYVWSLKLIKCSVCLSLKLLCVGIKPYCLEGVLPRNNGGWKGVLPRKHEKLTFLNRSLQLNCNRLRQMNFRLGIWVTSFWIIPLNICLLSRINKYNRPINKSAIWGSFSTNREKNEVFQKCFL